MRKAEFLVMAFLVAAFCSAQINVLPIEVALLADESRSFILADYEVHEPILIEDSTNGSEFESLGFSGNGTVENPFVIEGLSINGSGASPCIEIRNPRASSGEISCYFIIRDCHLYNGIHGIYMIEATVGIIEHNVIIDSADWGIGITPTGTMVPVRNITIRNNILSDNYNGNDMAIWGRAWNFTIVNNTGNGRVWLEFPRNVPILNNTFSQIFLSGSSIYRSDCSIIGNNIDYIEIDDIVDVLNDESSIIVANNTISDRLKIQDTNNCQVHDNDFVAFRRWMVILSNADNNTFTSNAFNSPPESALFNIDFSSDSNLFDYNYYSDYDGVDANGDGVGDIPYENWGVLDIHPLMYPPGSSPLLDSPDDIEFEEGTTNHSIVWSPSILSPASYRVHRNGSLVVDSGVWNGSIIVSVDGLSLGAYNYTLTIFDARGNSASDTVFVTVVEPTPPTIDSPDDIQYESGTTDHNITWSPSDLTPDSYEVLRNGTQIGSGSWGGSDIEISIDGLDLGTHNFTLVVFDAQGNNVGDTVMVIVVDTTDPSLSTPEDIQFKFGDAGHNLAWMLQDINPFSYEVFMNSTLVASGTWNSTAETVTIAVDGISVGIHFFTIYVTDLAGNEASDMVIVTVLPDGTITDTTTTNPPADSQFQIMDVLGLGIGFGVLLSVIVFVVLRKRE
jgi:nitrous oxidase accessory protein NosD